jgi:hypothetical protein
MLTALAAVILGIAVRAIGSIKLADPAKAYEAAIDLSEAEFQRHALYFAGLDFADNRRMVARKAAAALWMTGLFVGDIACLVVWLAHA